MVNFVYFKEQYKNIAQYEVATVKAKYQNTSDLTLATGKEGDNIPNSILCEFDINQVGDSYEKKICNVCGKLLPVGLFSKNQNGKGNRTVRRPSCDSCRKIIDGKSISSKERRKWAKTKPNLKVWTCPICHKTAIAGVTVKVVLDHDHQTGHPRAWICDSCNTGLGRFKDNIDTFQNAIKYLKKYNNTK